MKADEKKILKLILENDQDIKRVKMDFDKLAKDANMTIKEVYKIVTILLTRNHVSQILLSPEEKAKLPEEIRESWNVTSLQITEKGLNALETNWHEIIKTGSIGVALIISIIAIFYNPQ